MNIDDQACELVDPISVALLPERDEQIERGSFFPMIPFDRPLEPGQQAIVGIENERCDLFEGERTQSVRILFDDNLTIEIPLEIIRSCGVSWEGFSVWE